MVKLILRKHNKNSYNIHNADYDGCIEHPYNLLTQHSKGVDRPRHHVKHGTPVNETHAAKKKKSRGTGLRVEKRQAK